MRTVQAGSAVVRLRRTRALMTVLFAGTTAVCLALLAVLALQIDASSRDEQLVSEVTSRAGGLARAVFLDEDGSLNLEPLEQVELAVGASFVGIYRLDSDMRVTATAFLSSPHSIELTDTERDDLVADALEREETVSSTLRSPSGAPITWGSAAVYGDDTIGAVVIVGQDASALAGAHDRLLVGLVVGCVALLLAAGIAGYRLSGRAMRPATDALTRQEQFLTEAAHELRSPLTALRLTLETGDPGSSHRAQATVDRIDHLVTSLLLRARINAGTFEPERIRLRLDQLAEQVIEESADRESIVLRAEPVVVIGDPVLLGQAIRNLLDNAHRYAPGTVHIDVASHRVTISDHGPGIPAKTRPAMLQSGVGTGEGTGTGLAIVGWVAQLHGGSLTLGDAPGGGLQVDMVFPLGG